jgi:carboxymethylenebutenolidase
MRIPRHFLCSLLLSLSALGQSTQSMVPQTVEFLSGKLHLRAYLWKPAGTGPFPAVLFNHGSGGADADHTAGMPITQAANVLAPFFIKHGYAFLYPFRRGHGPSASQAPFMQDVLRREEESKGKDARQHLQFVLLATDQLDDVMAALAFLKTVPGIDPQRVAVAGHSLGGA